MAADKSPNIQDIFLNTLRKKRVAVTIFLANGVKLQGNITAFDNFSILLRRGPQLQLVYKHTVATIVPAGDVNLIEEENVESQSVRAQVLEPA